MAQWCTAVLQNLNLTDHAKLANEVAKALREYMNDKHGGYIDYAKSHSNRLMSVGKLP